MSDDDDYMSSAILSKIEDIKPGVSTSREGKRMLRINANRASASEKQMNEKPKSKDEREKTMLEEGLMKPICSESKGFKLLAMMGYKQGMSLGRRMEGIKEPISMNFKADRTGIGLDQDRREKQKELCEAHMESMRKRAMKEDELAIDFRRNKRNLAERKQLIVDIQKLRKTCQELDVRSGIEVPEEFWFWPIYSNKGVIDDEDEEECIKPKKTKIEDIDDDEEHTVRYTYSNGRTAEFMINFHELTDDGLRNSLSQIISYVRQAHHYCFYCGCTFVSLEAMLTDCPGATRRDHEE